MSMTYEIIIPFYNEAHRLGPTVEGFAAEIRALSETLTNQKLRFWWTDDGSTDGSTEQLKRFIAQNFRDEAEHKLLRCEQNRGKGATMRFAISELKKVADPHTSIVAFWDADGELHPSSLFEALSLVESGVADIVFGSRFAKTNPQVLNFRHYLGNKLLTLVSNVFSNLNLSDVHCCARIARAELLFQIPLKTDGFDFEAEFAALVGKIRSPQLKLVEVPVFYIPRTVEEGKKIGIGHVLPQVWTAVKTRYFHPTIRLNVTKLAAKSPSPRSTSIPHNDSVH